MQFGKAAVNGPGADWGRDWPGRTTGALRVTCDWPALGLPAEFATPATGFHLKFSAPHYSPDRRQAMVDFFWRRYLLARDGMAWKVIASDAIEPVRIEEIASP